MTTPLINSRKALEERLAEWGFGVTVNTAKSWTLTAQNNDRVEIMVSAKKDGSMADFKVVSVSKKRDLNIEAQRVNIAVENFLIRRDMEIVGRDVFNAVSGARFDFVCVDDGEIVFVIANATTNEEEAFKDALSAERKDYEVLAAKWLYSNAPEGDTKVRFDICELLILGSDRALIRHHVSAFGEK